MGERGRWDGWVGWLVLAGGTRFLRLKRGEFFPRTLPESH